MLESKGRLFARQTDRALRSRSGRSGTRFPTDHLSSHGDSAKGRARSNAEDRAMAVVPPERTRDSCLRQKPQSYAVGTEPLTRDTSRSGNALKIFLVFLSLSTGSVPRGTFRLFTRTGFHTAEKTNPLPRGSGLEIS